MNLFTLHAAPTVHSQAKRLAWPLRLAAMALGLLLLAPALRAEPDEQALGKAQGYPVGTRDFMGEAFRVGSWSGLDQVKGLPIGRVPAADAPSALPRHPAPPAIKYRHRNLGYTLDEYLERQRTTGLLILHKGQIVAERYRYERQDSARFLSFSMAKSVTALLVGQAQARGLIASLDDPAERYAPALAGSAYGQTSIRHLLRMSSGIRFTEVYNGNDDVSRLSAAVRGPNGDLLLPLLRSFSDRVAPPGSRFAYASAETMVLGLVLAGATGRPIAELTREWLWQPLGAEHEAFWCQDTRGLALTYFCFNASLRDWGRLGLMLAQDGRMGERQIVPSEFLLDGTDPARGPASHQPYRATPGIGYGYQFWILPLKTRTFALQGVHGQAVYVQPESGIVMVHTAVFKGASGALDPDAHAERNALWLGVLNSLGGSTQRY